MSKLSLTLCTFSITSSVASLFLTALFSKEEFKSAIANCNNSSTPGPDKLSWSHLKIILKNNKCLSNIISIANTCIDLGY